MTAGAWQVRITATGGQGHLLTQSRLSFTLVMVGHIVGGVFVLKALWRVGTSAWEEDVCWYGEWIGAKDWLAAFDQFRKNGRVSTAITRSLETITVSGVQFPDALRVERTLSYEEAQFRGPPLLRPLSTTIDWYAPGFGRVKRTVRDSEKQYDLDITGAVIQRLNTALPKVTVTPVAPKAGATAAGGPKPPAKPPGG